MGIINGLIYLTILILGFFIGSKFEIKKRNHIKNNIENSNEEKNIENIEYSNGLTDEIIDEWMNGSDIK